MRVWVGSRVGCRRNGMLEEQRMEEIQALKDSVGWKRVWMEGGDGRLVGLCGVRRYAGEGEGEEVEGVF